MSRQTSSRVMLSPRVGVYLAGDVPPVDPLVLWLPQVASHAFGDGSHPTTRLCAGAVDVMSRRVRSVLDVGTGTGILARIARARGATFVVATDIDAHALETAQGNALLDGARLRVENAPPDHWGPRFELVVANILQKPLVELAPLLRRALAPGGTLLLSGFTPAEAPVLRATFGAPVSEAVLEGWMLLAWR